MKSHLWVWICAGGALGLLALVAAASLAGHIVQLPTREPWPTTFPVMAVPATPVEPAPGVSYRTPDSAPTLSGHMPAPVAKVWVNSATWKDHTLSIAVTVQQIWGDYLLEPPVLLVEDRKLPVMASALTAARMALLTLGAGSETTLSLPFADTPAAGVGTLVFNPGSIPDSIIAPRAEVTVTWPLTVTATPMATVRP